MYADDDDELLKSCIFLNIYFLYTMCYLFVSSNDTTKKSYGVTSPISLSEPTSIDITLSKSLEETLRSHDMFESKQEMAKR